MSPTTLQTARLLGPELVVAGVAVLVYLGGAFVRSRIFYLLLALVGLGVAAWLLCGQGANAALAEPVASGPILIDPFSTLIRWTALAVGVGFVLTASRAAPDRLAPEYLGSLLLLVAGLMLVGSAAELILLFLALELISIPTYILLFLGRNDAASEEATAKYFFLSILASAFLLYGFSLLYGVSGSTRLAGIHEALVAPAGTGPAAVAGLTGLAPVGVLLVLAGLGFKLTAVPFHFYAPDVYQGTTSVNAGLLSVLPKLAGLAALVRLLETTMPAFAAGGWQVLLALSIVTMTLGNAVALWQQNVRRLMAYSAIAHAGYLLIGLAVAVATSATGGAAQANGFGAALFYVLVYAMATLGVFAALAYLAARDQEVERVDDLAGLSKTSPMIAAAVAIFMFSLTGIPPLAGFWGKLALITSALRVTDGPLAAGAGIWFVILAVVAVLNAAVSAGYYLRVVAVMYFRPAAVALEAAGGQGARLVTAAAAMLVVAAGLLPGRLFEVTAAAGAAAATARPAPAVVLTAGARSRDLRDLRDQEGERGAPAP